MMAETAVRTVFSSSTLPKDPRYRQQPPIRFNKGPVNTSSASMSSWNAHISMHQQNESYQMIQQKTVRTTEIQRSRTTTDVQCSSAKRRRSNPVDPGSFIANIEASKTTAQQIVAELTVLRREIGKKTEEAESWKQKCEALSCTRQLISPEKALVTKEQLAIIQEHEEKIRYMIEEKNDLNKKFQENSEKLKAYYENQLAFANQELSARKLEINVLEGESSKSINDTLRYEEELKQRATHIKDLDTVIQKLKQDTCRIPGLELRVQELCQERDTLKTVRQITASEIEERAFLFEAEIWELKQRITDQDRVNNEKFMNALAEQRAKDKAEADEKVERCKREIREEELSKIPEIVERNAALLRSSFESKIREMTDTNVFLNLENVTRENQFLKEKKQLLDNNKDMKSKYEAQERLWKPKLKKYDVLVQEKKDFDGKLEVEKSKVKSLEALVDLEKSKVKDLEGRLLSEQTSSAFRTRQDQENLTKLKKELRVIDAQFVTQLQDLVASQQKECDTIRKQLSDQYENFIIPDKIRNLQNLCEKQADVYYRIPQILGIDLHRTSG